MTETKESVEKWTLPESDPPPDDDFVKELVLEGTFDRPKDSLRAVDLSETKKIMFLNLYRQ